MDRLNKIIKYNNSIKLRVLKNNVPVSEASTLNIVTNTGHAAYIDGGFPSYIALGTGSHPEVPTVNALEKFTTMLSSSWTEIGGTVVDTTANTISRTFQLTKVFPVEKVNRLYSEIGIVDNKQVAFTYARLRDSTGEPTTITVLQNEQLEVAYTFTVSLPYKHVDEDSGYTCYIHNIPAPHKVRNAQWTSNESTSYFNLFNDSLDRLESGLRPTTFSGSRKNGRYSKRNNTFSVSVATAIGAENTEYSGVFCHSPSNDSDFSFSILFDSPKAVNEDAYYNYSFTIPYLGA